MANTSKARRGVKTGSTKDWCHEQRQADAQHWQTPDDFYKALLRKLGAPERHGHGIAALINSLIVGDINVVEPPLRIVVRGLNHASETAFDELLLAFSALARCGATAHVTSDHASIEIGADVTPFPTGQTRS